MKIAFVLHIHQPPTQDADVTRRITQRSYLPLVDILKSSRAGQVTLNITGSLATQLSALGYDELLADLHALADGSKVEYTSTGAYHPLLSELPQDEVVRQLTINNTIQKKLIGSSFQPVGVYPPELMYHPKVGETLDRLGYQWVLLDESAFPSASYQPDTPADHRKLELGSYVYTQQGTNLKLLFRDRELSGKIAFQKDITIERFRDHIEHQYADKKPAYIVLALDGETFGHHHGSGHLTFLSDVLDNTLFETCTVSSLFALGLKEKVLLPVSSTWGEIKMSSNNTRVFPRWINPDNPLHDLQWRLVALALDVVSDDTPEARELLDQGLHSDQFWWAAHDPCWRPDMVEKGARILRDAVAYSSASQQAKQKADELFENIIQKGRDLYGEVPVEC